MGGLINHGWIRPPRDNIDDKYLISPIRNFLQNYFMQGIVLLFFFVACCSASIYWNTLKVIHRARGSQHSNDYRTQQEIWTLLDNLNDSPLPRSKPHLILHQVIEVFTLKYDAKMAEKNSLENFRKQLKGQIVMDPPVPILFIISHELLLALDLDVQALLIEQVLMTEFVPYGEFLLSQIKRPLDRFYVQKAYEHFKVYFAYKAILKLQPHTRDILESHICHFECGPEENLKKRVDLLRSAIPTLFKPDTPAVPLLLCTSWSLAQYLLFMSRLYPIMQDEICYVLSEYFSKLQLYFCSTQTSICRIK